MGGIRSSTFLGRSIRGPTQTGLRGAALCQLGVKHGIDSRISVRSEMEQGGGWIGLGRDTRLLLLQHGHDARCMRR